MGSNPGMSLTEAGCFGPTANPCVGFATFFFFFLVVWSTWVLGVTYRKVGNRGSFSCWILSEVGDSSALSCPDGMLGHADPLCPMGTAPASARGVVATGVCLRRQSQVRALFPSLFLLSVAQGPTLMG